MPSVSRSRVVLLFGGDWEERDVSIASAQRVAAALRDDALSLTPVRWDAGGWVVLANDETQLSVPGIGRSPLEVMGDLCADGIGVVFNCLHGGPGEDGTVQGLFELAGVAYTGAGVHGSVAGFNKELFRFAAQALGLAVAPGAVIHRQTWEQNRTPVLTDLAVDLGFPAIVKPVCSGSSCRVTPVEDAEGLDGALEGIFTLDRRALVERFIPGREISIAVLGTRIGSPPQVLPPIEIEPLTDSGFFDYEAKYSKGKARETVPAALDGETVEMLNERVVLLHEELELGGVSRTDLIIGPDGPVFLETNTLPGLTGGSLVPQTAAVAGIDFRGLCRRLIDYALSVHLARRADSPHGMRS
ncbi:MAG: hypothetical protein L0Z55_02335 [Planctomycetes bacterium]|nr:hypothetical protein [Planctomycetota bacterium]